MDRNSQQALHNICIVTTQRSGSTWLMQLLNSTGRVKAYGEVFLEWATVDDHPGDTKLLPPRFFADYARSSGRPRVSAYVEELEHSDERPVAFKIMYDQVRRRPAILLQPMFRHYLIVHLVRRNHLDTVMSRLLARQTRVWHSRSRIQQPVVSVPPSDLLAMLRRLEWQTRLAATALKMVPQRKIDLAYEDLAADPGREVNRILTAAGLAPSTLDAASDTWLKTNNRTAREVFGNYAEIEAALKETQFAWMLGEARLAASAAA
jgi:LPS sulfotransferase NodH